MDNHDDDLLPEESDVERDAKTEATAASQEADERFEARPHMLLRTHVRPQEMFAIVGGFGLLALLLVSEIVQAFPIHPIFPLASLIFFLYPFRRIIVPRRLMQLGLITFFIWLFANLSGVLFPFILAFVIAYLFSPLVTRLAERGIPRWSTALGILLAILGVYTLIGVLIVPGLIEEFDQLIDSAGKIFQDTTSFLDKDRLTAWLAEYGIPRQQARDFITKTVEPQLKATVGWLFSNLTTFVQNVSSVLEGVMNLILIPILAYSFLKDFDKIRIFIRSTLLQDNPKYVYYVKNVDVIVSSYMRGMMITSSLVGATSVAILSIFNVPYGVVIGILTGVFNLIPTVGMFLNLGVAMIIFIFSPGDFWQHTLITAAMIAGLHAINAYFVEPRIVGERVGLHPVILIASLFVFAHFLGFIGLVVAVPATAVILMFLKEWYKRTLELRKPVVITPPSSPQTGSSTT